MSSPANLYLCLQDDGSASATTPRWRRLGALALALLMLAAVPLMWASSDAMATTAPKAGLASSSDDDNSGPGGGNGDDDDDDPANTANGTATQSRDATNTANTGVSTKAQTATQSRDATNTANTGVSTKPQTATQSRDETQTKNTGVSTRGSR